MFLFFLMWWWCRSMSVNVGWRIFFLSVLWCFYSVGFLLWWWGFMKIWKEAKGGLWRSLEDLDRHLHFSAPPLYSISPRAEWRGGYSLGLWWWFWFMLKYQCTVFLLVFFLVWCGYLVLCWYFKASNFWECQKLGFFFWCQKWVFVDLVGFLVIFRIYSNIKKKSTLRSRILVFIASDFFACILYDING